jgi:hypothetical protein
MRGRWCSTEIYHCKDGQRNDGELCEGKLTATMTRKWRRRILKTEIRTRLNNMAGPLKNLIGIGRMALLRAASVSQGRIRRERCQRGPIIPITARIMLRTRHIELSIRKSETFLPIAGGVRSKQEIENHDGTVRGGQVGNPDMHTYVNPAKSKTSQEIGRTRKQNQTAFDAKYSDKNNQ